ncbi:hypothetical protein ACFXJO_30060, partial [Streptomyces lavendulae]|uniref:hypothetical protein n=1 Tax=Streptomyces lavendulae TaxID=1914 RepID=UPI00369F084B
MTPAMDEARLRSLTPGVLAVGGRARAAHAGAAAARPLARRLAGGPGRAAAPTASRALWCT